MIHYYRAFGFLLLLIWAIHPVNICIWISIIDPTYDRVLHRDQCGGFPPPSVACHSCKPQSSAKEASPSARPVVGKPTNQRIAKDGRRNNNRLFPSNCAGRQSRLAQEIRHVRGHKLHQMNELDGRSSYIPHMPPLKLWFSNSAIFKVPNLYPQNLMWAKHGKDMRSSFLQYECYGGIWCMYGLLTSSSFDWHHLWSRTCHISFTNVVGRCISNNLNQKPCTMSEGRIQDHSATRSVAI